MPKAATTKRTRKALGEVDSAVLNRKSSSSTTTKKTDTTAKTKKTTSETKPKVTVEAPDFLTEVILPGESTVSFNDAFLM